MPIWKHSILAALLALGLSHCAVEADGGEPCTNRGEVKYCLCDDGYRGQRVCTRPDPPTIWTECDCTQDRYDHQRR